MGDCCVPFVAGDGGGGGGGTSVDNGVAIFAGTSLASSGTATFSNSNGVSFGMSAQTLTATFAALKTISGGTTNATGQGVSFANGSGVSFGINGNTITASVAAQTPFGISAGSQSVSTGTVSFADGNGISFGMAGSQTVTASYDGLRSVEVIGEVGNATITGSLLAFANITTTVGQGSWLVSGANTIQFAIPQNNGIKAIEGPGSIATSGTVSFANAGLGVVFGMAGNTITASAQDLFSYNQFNPFNAYSAANAAFDQSSIYVMPFAIRNVAFSQLAIRLFFTGGTDATVTVSVSYHFGLFTRNVSTLSLVMSTSFNSNVLHSGTVNNSLYAAERLVTAPWTSSITQGDYWIGQLIMSATAGTTNATNSGVSLSNFVPSIIGQVFSGPFGAASSTSNQIMLGLGQFSNSNAIPNSIAFSDIRGTQINAGRPPMFTLGPASV